MRKHGCTGRSLFFAAVFLAVPAFPARAQNLVVYDDALQNGFADWGWAPDRDFANTTQHHAGTSSVSFSSDASWQGITLHGNVDGSVYDAVLVWVRGSAAGLRYDVSLSGIGTSVFLGDYIAGGAIPNGSWALATIPFSALGLAAGGGASGIVVQAEGAQGTIFLDDIALRALPVAPITVAVDPNGTRTPINPLVYGVAHFDEAGSSQLAYPARRWGGNATTRYNWEIDVSNHAFDWFFQNIPNSVADPSQLPNNSSADLWIDSTKAHGGEPVLTIPTLGWAPKGSDPATDRVKAWGYSVAAYGPQQETECTVEPSAWCIADAGNGCTPDSPPGTCTFLAAVTDPTDTSKPVTPAYETAWLDHIATRVGWAAAGGVKYLILDNEPMLWNSTHHDVHPSPVTYDELWAKSRDTAAALKAKDPNAQVLGGAAFGFCEYFNSSKDSSLYGACGPGAVANPASDYATHGNLHWYPYLLQQAEAYRLAHGVRLLDFLDAHFYPAGANVALKTDESSATSALRLRQLRGLWDPTYTDESWIGQPVNLVPRLRAWIAAYAPGTKIAINEYNFGDAPMGATSALAQAEALAIFGREGVAMANRWVVPPANSLIEDAFLLYLNYDGAGAKVSGDSVPAASSNTNLVGSYAVRGTDRLHLLLFNHDTSSRDVTVTFPGGLTATAALRRFSGSMRLGSAGTAPVAGGTLSLTLPARSATLATMPYGSCAADTNPPVVTPPAGIVIDQTTCCGTFGGATFATSGALATFVAGGSATDDCTPAPTRLAARVGGGDVSGATCFPAGTTEVTFRFQDAASNIGSATSNVTVRMFADLNQDNLVDPSDMVVMRAYFNFAIAPGTAPFTAPLGMADLNHDAAVDPTDLVLLRAYFNFAVSCLAP